MRMYFSLGCLAVLALEIAPTVHAFLPSTPARASWTRVEASTSIRHRQLSLISLTRLGSAANDNDDEEDEDDENEPKKVNPFADPNYPDLEFVDYSDPEYQVDQGTGEEFSDPTSTDEEIELMRQDRRRRNDEYQFQTYFSSFLKSGDEYKGEWTVYKTSTFLPSMEMQADGLPRLVKAGKPLKVVSSAYKTTVVTDSPHPTDKERIRHEERAVADSEIDSDDDDDDEDDDDDNNMPPSPEAIKTEKEIMKNKYWPEQLAATDFQGQQGTMCVGTAYTIATGVALSGQPLSATCEGPFKEYRAEIGLQSEELRFRVKFDYSVIEAEVKDSTTPPLHLKSMTVCCETRDMWPLTGKKESVADQTAVDALFGTAGASGGLYDPPPVGSDEQANQYMVLDLPGQATVLFPFKLDQAPEAFGGTGWVTSLDWTPDTMRYQVDRKVKGGVDLMCLRTLEVTEVQGMDADRYRPRDGGEDMRQ
jgi:hypothetical protein